MWCSGEDAASFAFLACMKQNITAMSLDWESQQQFSSVAIISRRYSGSNATAAPHCLFCMTSADAASTVPTVLHQHGGPVHTAGTSADCVAALFFAGAGCSGMSDVACASGPALIPALPESSRPHWPDWGIANAALSPTGSSVGPGAGKLDFGTRHSSGGD